MKKKEKSWHTRCLVFLVMEMRQGCCFICKQKLPDVESVLSCCTDRVALQAQMHFKGKIYPRDVCGLKITQTAAVGPALPLRGRDGEEFPPVRELHASGWSWKPEDTFLGQRKREQLLWPCCRYLSDQFLEISKLFHTAMKKCVLQSRTENCCPLAVDLNLRELNSWSRCFETLSQKERRSWKNQK